MNQKSNSAGDESENLYTSAAKEADERRGRRFRGLGRAGATALAATGLLMGGLGGGLLLAHAAPSPSPATNASSGAQAGCDTHGHRDGGWGQLTRAAADAIGISRAQLVTELKSGNNLTQVAQAHGVAPQVVESAMVTAANKRIDARLAAGEIIQAQADHRKSLVTQRVHSLMTKVPGQGSTPGGAGSSPAPAA